MDTEYDFTQTINNPQLLDEINTAGLPAPDYIMTNGLAVQIFYVSALTSDQQTILTNVLTNHVANPAYIPLAQQAQIAILISYLNNSNINISNTARSVIIKNLASNLPLTTLTTINSQIFTIVGS